MKRLISLLIVFCLLAPAVCASEWDLGALYPAQSDFKKELDSVRTQILPRMCAYEGRLRDPDCLLAVLTLLQQANERLQTCSVYAGLQQAADQTGPLGGENQNAVRNALESFAQGSENLRRELYALERGYLQGCLNDPRFERYAQLLLNALSGQGQSGALLSHYSHLLRLPSETAGLVLGPDFHPRTVARPDGTPVSATYTEWLRSRSSDDEAYRRAAYEAYHEEVRAHRNTLAALLDAHIRTAVQDAKRAGYDTPLRYAVLSRYELPAQTVNTLLENVRHGLALHRRFGELARKRQGKEQVYPWDVPPGGARHEKTYTYDDAKALVLESLQPLGREYASLAREMLEGGHIDVYPRQGKAGGAFAVNAGARTLPYILLNFGGSYDDLSTLTHELGHACHMIYANRNNEGSRREAAISTAETASTAHELLLIEHMLRTASDENDRRFFLSRYAELIGGTLFAQSQLFAFEMSLYATVQNGGAITADTADTLWRKYQQDFRDPGLVVPETADSYWGAVPHFYRDFYVMNYATSLTAAYALMEPIVCGGVSSRKAVDKFTAC
jgi:oligoendopeptidase F